MTSSTIDAVLAALDRIIDQSYRDRDRAGFFAALYRLVTAAVQRGIADGSFEDGARMERLDVAFAGRYLDAYECYRRGEAMTRSWRAAFEAGSRWRPVILQHLLLGMNAHINLDLGIAAAEVCPGDAIGSLRGDFDRINTLLATLETGVQDSVCRLSPWIDRLCHIDPRAGRVVANFSIAKARAASWDVATRLAPLGAVERAAAIEAIDADVASLGALIERPIGLGLNANLCLVRLRETKNVRRAIKVLGGST